MKFQRLQTYKTNSQDTIFQKTKNLKPNEYYVSELDLNVENKVIEIPYKPTIRVSKAIYNDKEFRGILIINFNASYLIDRLTNLNNFDVYIVDNQDNFLINPNSNKNWSTQLNTDYLAKDEIKDYNFIKYNSYDRNEYYYKKLTITDKPLLIIYKIKDKLYKQIFDKVLIDTLFIFLIVLIICFPLALITAYYIAHKSYLLDQIIKTIPYPIYVKDINGKIILANETLAKLFGYKNSKVLINKNSYKLENINTILNDKEKDNIALEKGALKTLESYNNEKQKYYFEMIRVKIPFMGVLNKTYILGLAIDITEIKHLNDALKSKIDEEIISRLKAEKIILQQRKMALMGEILKNISSEWKEPISAIKAITSGLKAQNEMDVLNNDMVLKGLDSIDNSTIKLTNTLDDFQNFFSPNKEKLYIKSIDIIEKSLMNVDIKLIHSNIKVNKNIESIEFLGFKSETILVITTILNEIIDTLNKSSENEKFIFIDVRKDENKILFNIFSNSTHYTKDIINDLFNPLTKPIFDKSNKISLYLCQELTKSTLDGKLDVELINYLYQNKNLKGVSFSVKLSLD